MAKGTSRLADGQITQESGTDSDLRQLKDDEFGSQRVYKKTSPNSLLTLYLGTRDVICRRGSVEPLRGVIYIDPKFTPSNKIYGQLTLTFRYGREDEEVMGLKFCNEAIIALKQIWPVPEDTTDELSTLQQALLDRLGTNAYPFTLDVGALAPPSVQLVPAKRYNGAPIGTSYDVRIHMGDPHEERPSRRCMVKLGVRVIHKITSSLRCSPEQTTRLNAAHAHTASALMSKTLRLRLSPKSLQLSGKFSTTMPTTTANAAADVTTTGGSAPATAAHAYESAGGGGGGGGGKGRLLSVGSCDGVGGRSSLIGNGCGGDGGAESRIDVEHGRGWSNDVKGPEGCVDKPFLWTEGRVSLRAALNKSAYGHGEHISVTIDVRNDSRKIIRKVRILAVQHVDVCMFSNGKFKNVVAEIDDALTVKPSERYRKVYSLLPIRGATKNWIAVEGLQSHYHVAPICQGVSSSSSAAAATAAPRKTSATSAASASAVCSHSTTTATTTPSTVVALEPHHYKIASSAPRSSSTATSPEDRNVFAIYVSYYIKVKLTLSAMGGEVTLKLPFILGHVDDDDDEDDDVDEENDANGRTDASSANAVVCARHRGSLTHQPHAREKKMSLTAASVSDDAANAGTATECVLAAPPQPQPQQQQLPNSSNAATTRKCQRNSIVVVSDNLDDIVVESAAAANDSPSKGRRQSGGCGGGGGGVSLLMMTSTTSSTEIMTTVSETRQVEFESCGRRASSTSGYRERTAAAGGGETTTTTETIAGCNVVTTAAQVHSSAI